IVLYAALMLAHNFRVIARLPTGIRSDGVVAVSIEPANAARLTLGRQTEVISRILRDAAAEPGTLEVCASGAPVLAGVRMVGLPIIADATRIEGTTHRAVTPGYFRTLGIPRLRGRDFENTDSARSSPVVIVNQAFAARAWRDQEAVGHTVMAGGRRYSVIGVVANSRENKLLSVPGPEIYTSLLQGPSLSFTILARSSLPAGAAVRALQTAVWSSLPNEPVTFAGGLNQAIATSIATQRLQAAATEILAVVGLGLALIGVYAVVACGLGRKRREIAIRMALGAKQRTIFGASMRSGLKLWA